MACSRAHAIKAALVTGFLLLLLNVLGPRLDVKYDKVPMSLIQKAGSQQWPKRTRGSSVIAAAASQINSTINSFQNNTPNVTNTSILDSKLSPIILNKTNSLFIDNLNLINTTNNKTENLNKTVIQSDIKLNKNLTHNEEESTKSNFIQNIMTTLGMNTCPPIPPNLDGPIEADVKPESLKIVEKRFGPKLMPGGWFKPIECNARDRVAIIVPYRDRMNQLPIFLKNLHSLLMKQQIEYGIFIVEQTKGSPFNRAALMNIGSVEALNLSNWDCFIFHDVDLLPLDDRNLYTCPDQPRHMSVAVDTLNFRLPYSSIFGGVSAMTVKQFQAVNGFSNNFWGWGGEDDDMSNRLKHVGFHIARYPVNIARYTMLSHKKEKANPKRYDQLINSVKRIDVDGLNSLKYKIKSLRKLPLYTWILAEITQEHAS